MPVGHSSATQLPDFALSTTARYAQLANDAVKASGSRVVDSIGFHIAPAETTKMILVTAPYSVIRRREDPAGVGEMHGRGDIETTSRYAHPVRDLAGRVNGSCDAKTGRPRRRPQ